MNTQDQTITKKYFEEHLAKALQEGFKEFGQTLMNIFVTKEEFKTELSRFATKEDLKEGMSTLRSEMNDMRQELKTDISILDINLRGEIQASKESVLEQMLEMKDEILRSNDKIAQKLVKRESEESAITYRIDRIESEHGARLTAVEQKNG